jgi:hypothetical protein
MQLSDGYVCRWIRLQPSREGHKNKDFPKNVVSHEMKEGQKKSKYLCSEYRYLLHKETTELGFVLLDI